MRSIQPGGKIDTLSIQLIYKRKSINQWIDSDSNQ